MTNQLCPKCGKPLGETVTTASGKKLQRCSAGFWNPDTKKMKDAIMYYGFHLSHKRLRKLVPNVERHLF